MSDLTAAPTEDHTEDQRPSRNDDHPPTRTEDHTEDQRPSRNDEGQTTAEYALVIAAVAVVVGGLITWASGSGSIEALFNAVLDRLTAAVGS